MQTLSINFPKTVYTTQACITRRPVSASNPEKKECSDVQHAWKIDQIIVTHEEYVAMLINCKWRFFIKGT